MPFKIVQTEENGRKFLSVVPHHWETCGTLFWPAKNPNFSDDSNANKPDKTFESYDCKLKRQGFDTYKEALDILKVMENQYDTDDKSVDQSATKKVQKGKGSNQKKKLENTPDLTSKIAKVSVCFGKHILFLVFCLIVCISVLKFP